MYIRANSYGLEGFGIPAAVGAAIELGSAALTFGAQLFRGGSFSTTSSVVNYVHENTPPERKPVRCTRRFRITAAKPGLLTPDFVKKHDMGDKFWFELSYQYNGNDLINVVVEPLVDKSSELSKSEFKITFTGNAYSPPRDPVSEIVFRISGTWKAWDPLPFMDTTVSFSGDLYVRADGSARVENFKSEKGLVWYGSMSNSCQVIAPFMAKAPVRKYFSIRPPILFPIRKAKVSPYNRKRILEWVKNLPATTKERIANGEITVTIEGFASLPGGEFSDFNKKLAKDRKENVASILMEPLGSGAKFDCRSYGAWQRNLPHLFDVSEWLRRAFDPNKYDQAVVIRFEDVG